MSSNTNYAVDPLWYKFQREGWVRPGDAEDAQNWRNLVRALHLAPEASYQGVLTTIRLWRAWAECVRRGVLAPLPDDMGEYEEEDA